MFYKEKEEPELREELFENPGATYRGAPFWAWNKKLNKKELVDQVEQFKKLEEKKIPKDLNYDDVGSLRIEARQKLKMFQPLSIGQASRISGVSPADISVLLVYLEQMRNNRKTEK